MTQIYKCETFAYRYIRILTIPAVTSPLKHSWHLSKHALLGVLLYATEHRVGNSLALLCNMQEQTIAGLQEFC